MNKKEEIENKIRMLKEIDEKKEESARMSHDKWEAIESICKNISQFEMPNFTEHKNSMIILEGGQGSGKTLIVNKISKIYSNYEIIKIDLWNLFGLRNHNDYEGHLPTAGQAILLSDSIYHTSYSISGENTEEETIRATKLNVRKILWKSIISSIEGNYHSEISTIFRNNKEEIIVKRRFLSGYTTISKTIFWLILGLGLSLLLLSLIFSYFNFRIDTTLITAFSGLLISFFSFYISKLTYVRTSNLNNFLIDENNHDSIKEYLKEKTKTKHYIIHLENIDRLHHWLIHKNVTNSSLIEDIIMILSLIYKSGNIHVIMELDTQTKNSISIFALTDYIKKIISEVVFVKSITNDIFNNSTNHNNLLSNSYFEIIKIRSHNLSYRLLDEHKECLSNLIEHSKYNEGMDRYLAKEVIIPAIFLDEHKMIDKFITKDEKNLFPKKYLNYTKGMYSFSKIIEIIKFLNAESTNINGIKNLIDWEYIIENEHELINIKDGLLKVNWLRGLYSLAKNDDIPENYFNEMIVSFYEQEEYTISISKESYAYLKPRLIIENKILNQKQIENYLKSINGFDAEVEQLFARTLNYTDNNFFLLEKYVHNLVLFDGIVMLIKENNPELFNEIIKKNSFENIDKFETFAIIHNERNFLDIEKEHFLKKCILKGLAKPHSILYRKSLYEYILKCKNAYTGVEKTYITKFLNKYK